jgi:hypothetical protein
LLKITISDRLHAVFNFGEMLINFLFSADFIDLNYLKLVLGHYYPLVIILYSLANFFFGDSPSLDWLCTLKLMVFMFFQQAELANHFFIFNAKEQWFFGLMNFAEGI